MDLKNLRDRAESLARRTRSAYLSEGVPGVARRSRNLLRRKLTASTHERPNLPDGPVTDPDAWPMSVLMIAERSLPQCYHYRVEQKRQILSDLGIPFRDVDQHDPQLLSLLQLARLVIVYRLAGGKWLDAVLQEAHRLGVPVIYEVDDLVYRAGLIAANPNLDTLPRSLRSAVIAGSEGYGQALRTACTNLASTRALAEDMAALNHRPAFVVENGIDDEMLEMAADLQAGGRPDAEGHIVAAYGSGSRAHDHDFAVAAPGLARWLTQSPQGRLLVIGPVLIPEALADVSAQIRRIEEPLAYRDYLRVLSQSTISLAPLADEPFNRFKSQVKYLESALVGVPLVASPTVYSDYVIDGSTALLAAEPDEWYQALCDLSADPELRRTLSESAREHVRRWELRNDPTQQMRLLLDEAMAAESR